MSAAIGEMTAPWNETTLPILSSNSKLKNIFNADEFDPPQQYPKAKTITHLTPNWRKAPRRKE